MDLVINLDPVPIEFWHRGFPKRISRGLILAIHSALGTGFEGGDRRLGILHGVALASAAAPPKLAPADCCVWHSFNLNRQQYHSVHNIP